ncbi:hypothetical protein MPTK1_4g21080 [Marchantia polymorpha subsp. ruderalis]|uniref:F-box domain-containing protein n=2 Tax=Marchantia polymorpha TaxID=3197 RepID=A0AAF6BC71_MARPO|nr:hypothetical protein MARPO_0101s0054 [Marchantia polymorpha]BBN09605.1 hypothetical protein Mp_4g21080 [Marchantia polymorpha subsp. ruderalis]|eukprot:PTQ32263.1 hypothetical protein MARPO_0101s0054 [Marchantia polymorpha]
MKDGEMRVDLTNELLHKVFSCLDDTTLCQAAMICKQWRVASNHDFWKSLNFEYRSVSHEQVDRLRVSTRVRSFIALEHHGCSIG